MWVKAANTAEKLQMRRESGLALFEIGRLARSWRSTSALVPFACRRDFEAIGAKADLAATRKACRSEHGASRKR